MDEPVQQAESAQASESDDAAASKRSPRRAWASPSAIAVFLAVVGLVTMADLLFKDWAFEHVANRPVELTPQAVGDAKGFWRRYPHQPTVVIPHVLHLRLTTNAGAVFGTAKGGKWIFIAVSIVAIGVIVPLFLRSSARAWPMHVALALILAGALGNLYDRLRFSVVRDMLHLFPTTGLWPWIFNIADASLMIGVGLMLVLTLVEKDPRKAAP